MGSFLSRRADHLAIRQVALDGRAEPFFVPHRTNVALDVDALRAQHPDPRAVVYLLDYCGPNAAFLMRLCELFPAGVTLLDHHSTAVDLMATITERPSNLRCVLDMGRSGATIALAENPKGAGSLAKVYAYVEDHDLFRHVLPDSEQFTAGLSSMRIEMDFNKNPYAVDQLLNLDFDVVMKVGAAEVDRQATLRANYLEWRYRVRFNQDADQFWSWADDIAANDYAVIPKLGHELAQMSDSGMGAVVRKADGVAQVSLCGVAGADTTTVSKRFGGGGGHKGASGFTVPTEQWESFRK